MVYNINELKIAVYQDYSDHKKKVFISGSLHNTLETGGSSHAREIKTAIKKYAIDNGFNIGSISHSIYGIYTADINN